MIYLFVQTWIWLLLAGLLGLLVGWLIWGREDGQSTGKLPVSAGQYVDPARDVSEPLIEPILPDPGAVEPIPVRDSWKPEPLDEPDGPVDNLQRIKGVGPVIEKTLNNLGIYHFRQIADFTDENIKWVDNYISFPGRIQREQWVAQAARLTQSDTP